MITAKETRELMANSEESILKQLAIIEKQIRASAASGKSKVEVTVPTDEFRDVLCERIKKEGFQIIQTHSRGFEIIW